MLCIKQKRVAGTVFDPKIIAIVGATASGKSGLAINIALQTNSMIFSIDSLSIYKEIDIVSAKPTLEERQGILHRGIDEVGVLDYVSAQTIANLYQDSLQYAKLRKKNLIIVGGSSFYLKSLLTGLSPLPHFSEETKRNVKDQLQDLPKAHAKLLALDRATMQKVQPTDSYRIEKNLLILEQTQQTATDYFASHKANPIIKSLNIFCIDHDREVLRQRIQERTALMLHHGLLDEICYLEKKYPRNCVAMQAIGVKESLEYLDAKLTLKELEERITTHTVQLAKRQTTFNTTQFETITHGSIEDIFSQGIDYLTTR